MSTEEAPTSDPQAGSTQRREITVSVPEDRVDQFHAFYERFLAMAERPQRRGGKQRGPSGRGRGHRRRHVRQAMFHLAMAEYGPGAHEGHCGRRQARDTASDPEPPATSE